MSEAVGAFLAVLIGVSVGFFLGRGAEREHQDTAYVEAQRTIANLHAALNNTLDVLRTIEQQRDEYRKGWEHANDTAERWKEVACRRDEGYA